MTLPITVLLKILIWHQMDISTNVDKHIHTHTHTHTKNKQTHTHLVTVNRCQRTSRWESSFSSVPYEKQYTFHTLLTQNAEVRIYKLHMRTHARAHSHAQNCTETTKNVIFLVRFPPPLVRKQMC